MKQSFSRSLKRDGDFYKGVDQFGSFSFPSSRPFKIVHPPKKESNFFSRVIVGFYIFDWGGKMRSQNFN